MSDPSNITGARWQMVINGRRTLNGKRHSVTLEGDVQLADEGVTVFDLLHDLAIQAADDCDMEYPDSLQVTIFPAKSGTAT